MSPDATVSCVIPAYNAAAFIRRALESVLAQSCPVNEVIVVDDGSKDDTLAVLATFGPRIRVITQANAGAAAARNRGLAESTGAWVAFLDADDWWEPDRLRLGRELLARHPGLHWTAGAYWVLESGGARRLVPDARQSGRVLGDGEVVADFYEAAWQGVAFHTISYLIRRTLLVELGGFRADLPTGEDLDLWWRIADRSPRVGFVRQPIATYDCSQPGSLTRVERSHFENLWKLVGLHAAAGSAPTDRPGGASKERILTREIWRMMRHAIRVGEPENVRRVLDGYAQWLPARERAIGRAASVLSPAALRRIGRTYRGAIRLLSLLRRALRRLVSLDANEVVK